MLDQNGKYTVLSLSEAQTITLAEAATAGVEVPSGSAEDQINNWQAQQFVQQDGALYALYVKMFNPTGTDIDLQNPGTPRLQPGTASGYLELNNTGGGSPVNVGGNTMFTAPNGNVYTNGGAIVTVDAGETGFVNVVSVLEGKAQNLPADQSFSSIPDIVIPITNPQPFVDGRDLETDTEYLSRLVYLRTNNTSQQATPAAVKELLTFYPAARFYINNTSNDLVTPVPVPTGGYVSVIILPSGPESGPEEIANAVNVLAARFEFGNILNISTTLHPIITGIIYTGTFPQVFAIAPAQVVEFTLTAELSVSFATGTDSSEKSILAAAFAVQFVQNLVNFYGGAAGDFNMTFQEAGSPTPDPVVSTQPVLAANIPNFIAPVVAIEQIRAFISDEKTTAQLANMHYLTCDALEVVLDTQESGESPVTLDIDAPSGGTVAVVDFVNDALFTDDTSWYDRYLFLDPSLITITVNEV